MFNTFSRFETVSFVIHWVYACHTFRTETAEGKCSSPVVQNYMKSVRFTYQCLVFYRLSLDVNEKALPRCIFPLKMNEFVEQAFLTLGTGPLGPLASDGFRLHRKQFLTPWQPGLSSWWIVSPDSLNTSFKKEAMFSLLEYGKKGKSILLFTARFYDCQGKD